MKLTQRRIEALECPTNKKDMLVFDDEQRGLGVRVTAGGGKSFLVQYRHAGEKRRMPLGSCSAISLAKARLTAQQISALLPRARDPAGERKAAALEAKREALTLAALIEQWEALHLKRKRPNYSTAATATLRRVFVEHLDMPAGCLDRAVVVRVLDGLAKDGKAAMAGATARYGSALFGWAVKRGSSFPIRLSASRSPRRFAATACCRTMKSAAFGRRPRARERSTRSCGRCC